MLKICKIFIKNISKISDLLFIFVKTDVSGQLTQNGGVAAKRTALHSINP